MFRRIVGLAWVSLAVMASLGTAAGSASPGGQPVFTSQEVSPSVVGEAGTTEEAGLIPALEAETLARGKGRMPPVKHPRTLRKLLRRLDRVVIPLTSGEECSGGVCMQLIGTKLKLKEWWVAAVIPAHTCTYGTFWKSKTEVWFNGPELCSGGESSLYYDDQTFNNREFANGTWLCNTVLHVSGKPCAEIHS
jgi:hypothetical protein